MSGCYRQNGQWVHHVDSRCPSPSEDDIPLRELINSRRRRLPVPQPSPPTTVSVFPRTRLSRRPSAYAAAHRPPVDVPRHVLLPAERQFIHRPRPACPQYQGVHPSSLPPPDFWSPTSPTGRGYIVEAPSTQQAQQQQQVPAHIQYPQPVHHAQHVRHPHHAQSVQPSPATEDPYAPYHLINRIPSIVYHADSNEEEEEPGLQERMLNRARNTKTRKITVNIGGALFVSAIIASFFVGLHFWKKKEQDEKGYIW